MRFMLRMKSKQMQVSPVSAEDTMLLAYQLHPKRGWQPVQKND